MRSLLAGLAVMALSALLLTGSQAGDAKKEVTLKGTITCAKCDLGTESACKTVIVTKENGKDVTIYFDGASHGKHHDAICTEAKKGTITGVVSVAGGKKTVAVKNLKFD